MIRVVTPYELVYQRPRLAGQRVMAAGDHGSVMGAVANRAQYMLNGLGFS